MGSRNIKSSRKMLSAEQNVAKQNEENVTVEFFLEKFWEIFFDGFNRFSKVDKIIVWRRFSDGMEHWSEFLFHDS